MVQSVSSLLMTPASLTAVANPTPPQNRTLQMMQSGLVSHLVSTYHPDQYNAVHNLLSRGMLPRATQVRLLPPQAVATQSMGTISQTIQPTPQLQPLPSTNQSGMSPRSQLTSLGQKYGVSQNSGESYHKFQKRVAKAILTYKAQQYGIPLHVAMGIAGNESNWTMWKDIDSNVVIQGRNVRDGVLKSTDWGVMQINDKAHPRAFPRAKTDMEYNIDYGLKYLSRQRSRIQGSLGLGLGDWDRTVASYNLGHNPKTERSLSIANRYVSHVKKRSAAYA